MIKRILAALLLMAMILPGLLACGNTDAGPSETGTETGNTRPESETPGSPAETSEQDTGSGTETETAKETKSPGSLAETSEQDTGSSTETETAKETESETDPAPKPASEPTLPNYLKASSVIRENMWNVNSEEAGTAFVDPSQAKTYSSEKIQSFWIRTQENERIPFSVSCHISGGCISAVLPAGIDLSRIVPVFEAGGHTVLDEEGREVASGETALDLTRERTLHLDGDPAVYRVLIENLSTGLPSLSLSTSDFSQISDKVNWIPSRIYIGGGDPSVCSWSQTVPLLVDGAAKGRGNTSWGFPKKGYNVKLESKHSFLGLPSHKKFCLVSNYQDKSLMRNYLGAELSLAVGMKDTMQVRFVDLWYNGKYHGNYTVIEKIEIDKNSINIPKYDPAFQPNEMGYILEWDGHVNEVSGSQKEKWQAFGEGTYDPVADAYFINLDGHWMTFKDPDENLTPEMLNYVADRWRKAVQALDEGNEDKIRTYLDPESAAQWFIVEDLMMNMDASFHTSVYMYLDGNGIFHMGPVWDFDLGAGNANYGNRDTSSSYLQGSYIIRKLFKLDFFKDDIYSLWTDSYDRICAALTSMDRMAGILDISAKLNFQRWDVLNKKVGANDDWVLNYTSFDSQIVYLQAFLRRRIAYIQNLIAGEEYSAMVSRKTPWKGSGTQTDPYLIQNETDFLRLVAKLRSRKDCKGEYYLQTADLVLDLNATTDSTSTFAGTYDGGGWKIICETVGGNACLFPYVSGHLRNIQVFGISIRNTEQAAGLCRSVRSGATVVNCAVYGEIYSATHSVAGLTSSIHANAAILNCVIVCDLQGNGSVGGLTAYEGGDYRVENCFAEVSGSKENMTVRTNRIPVELADTANILNASLADWERELNLPSGTLCRWNGDGDALVMIPGTRK